MTDNHQVMRTLNDKSESLIESENSHSTSQNRSGNDIEAGIPLIPGNEVAQTNSLANLNSLQKNSLNESYNDAKTELDETKVVRTGNGHKSRKYKKPFLAVDYHGPTPDINTYQHKKTVAQGFLDLALISANANQLRNVLESKSLHPYYYFSISLITTSLIIQVFVGIGLVCNSRYNINNEREIREADRINNLITTGILLTTVINVFVSAFGIADGF